MDLTISNPFAYGAWPFLPLPLEPGGAFARVSMGDGPPSHEKEKQVCGFSSWLLPNHTRERVPPFIEIRSRSLIDQFDKYQFSRLSSNILQKDFLLETNWVRDLQSSNFCSITPWRLVGARATREGGVLLLKLISEIVNFLYSVRFSNHRISYDLPSANYIHCSITDFPMNCPLWISFISSFFLLSHHSWGSCIYSVVRWSLFVLKYFVTMLVWYSLVRSMFMFGVTTGTQMHHYDLDTMCLPYIAYEGLDELMRITNILDTAMREWLPQLDVVLH